MPGTADENGPDDGPESFIDRLRRENARAAADDQDGDRGVGPAADAPAADSPSSDGFDERADAREIDPGTGAGAADLAADVEASDGHSSGAPDASEADFASEADPHSAADSGTDADGEPERRMPPEARRALVSLMRQGVVLAPRKARVFEALVRHEAAIRAHLAELYLELVLDKPAGVAFIRNHAGGTSDAEAVDGVDDTEEEADDVADGATLISRRTLPLYDTLLLLILRKHYQERQTSGERRIVVDIERVESAFVPFLPLTASERSDRRKLNAAMTRLVDKRLLSRVRGDDQRFEITPVIRYVVDAAFLDALLLEYERLAGGAGEADDSSDEVDVPGAGSPPNATDTPDDGFAPNDGDTQHVGDGS